MGPGDDFFPGPLLALLSANVATVVTSEGSNRDAVSCRQRLSHGLVTATNLTCRGPIRRGIVFESAKSAEA
jgi:hypothetical protein